MKPLHLYGCRLLVGIALLSLAGCATYRPPAADDFLPMEQGTRWVYVREAAVVGPKGGIVSNVTQVECRLLETLRKPGFVAARYSAFPTDSDIWSADEDAHSPGVLVRAGYGQYHTTRCDAWSNLEVNANTLLFDAPFAVGKRWGDADTILRDDGWYGWRIDSEEDVFLQGIRGVSRWHRHHVYHLEYATCPDLQRVLFVPGIGVLEYTYHHNGTPSDVRLRLVEFERGR